MATEELREGRREPRTIPLEVLNAELVAKLDFTERRLLSMATVAFDLQSQCTELSKSTAAQAERIARLEQELTALKARAIDLIPVVDDATNRQRRNLKR